VRPLPGAGLDLLRRALEDAARRAARDGSACGAAAQGAAAGADPGSPAAGPSGFLLQHLPNGTPDVDPNSRSAVA
jgi:hypothetical protein